ncbi:flavodoxin family protein [Limosilactobacillus caecicola]|uniref:flavodoxin family protein n=1 Tax=Limosilactobacillus caecicola TaxID=2941332 RepID=UPI00204041D1|nr:NAD(P)H-dependent oxidoreductase [Limosilactobacillus caecicola]
MLIINGSPRKNGAVRAITDQFSTGAQEAGQEVTQFDVGVNPLPMLSVDQENNFQLTDQRLDQLKQAMSLADTIVFTTPLYLFGMSAQMKTVVDYMQFWDHELRQEKTGVLIAVSTTDNFDHVKSEFKEIFDEFGWRFGGQVLAGKVTGPDHLRFYPQVAYELGKSL